MDQPHHVVTINGIDKTKKLSLLVRELKLKFNIRSVIGIHRTLKANTLESLDTIHVVVKLRREFLRLKRLHRLDLEDGIALVRAQRLTLLPTLVGRASDFLTKTTSVRICNISGSDIREMSDYVTDFLQAIEEDSNEATTGIQFIYDDKSRCIRSFCFASFSSTTSAEAFIEYAKVNWDPKYNFDISNKVIIIHEFRKSRYLRDLKLNGIVWLSPVVWKLNFLIDFT
ncbi:hypothetical protein PVAND_004048 [Polypedilum vanderplanki]|uniref:Uncharacterized protein n=1 Tax=Polypedilum vanderplanki TaxID=319348 RepID=A0A9J6BVZ7_POLVA|nr:hypothetical protein PVAND_004048 [Polypedilum vanderplanki]